MTILDKINLKDIAQNPWFLFLKTLNVIRSKKCDTVIINTKQRIYVWGIEGGGGVCGSMCLCICVFVTPDGILEQNGKGKSAKIHHRTLVIESCK